MKQSIAHIALVLADYNEAIRFYTEKLDFTLLDDKAQSETKRWILVAPKAHRNVARCWQKPSVTNKQVGSVTKRAGEFFCF
jgi:catechol 2,3-dioxygenase-like lactoylglutathione lyase family enzyme